MHGCKAASRYYYAVEMDHLREKSADSARLLLDSKCMLTGNGLRLCVMTTLKCDGCRERLRELIDALDHYE